MVAYVAFVQYQFSLLKCCCLGARHELGLIGSPMMIIEMSRGTGT